MSQAPQSRRHRPITRRVSQRLVAQVLGTQRRQDTNDCNPAAVFLRRPANIGQDLGQLTADLAKRTTAQRQRTAIDLQVEAVELQLHPRIAHLRQDLLVAQQRLRRGVDQVQLELDPDRGLTGAKARPRQHQLERRQVLAQLLTKLQIVGVRKLLLLDFLAHEGNLLHAPPACRR